MSRRVTNMVGVLAFVALSTACASTGAVPKPFPMPSGSPTPRPAAPPPAPPIGTPEAPAASLSPPPPGPPATTPADVYALVGTALELRGTPYRNGGADRTGFDCSGFTQYVFAQHGFSLPRAVRDQFKVGQRVTPAELAPGDLLFFATTGPGASHVGIAIGGDQFVHAPSSTGVVRVERLSASYWSARFLGARRLTPL